MKNIIWLASYPKSVNTWLRSFFFVLISNKKLDIIEIYVGDLFSDKKIIENILDIEPNTINQHLLDAYRRLAFQHLSDTVQAYIYVKIHDTHTLLALDNLPTVSADPSKKAIYIVRNPLDVVLSHAHHLRASVNSTINMFKNNPTAIISETNFRIGKQLPQILRSWTVHVKSWLEQQEIRVYLLKYENMLAQPFVTFKKMVVAIGLNATDLQIQNAIDATAFNNLIQLEHDQGFRERFQLNALFYNKGVAGQWKTALTAEQIDKVVAVNREMIKKLGYL